jgi:type I restriction enzyme S subunit
MSRPELSEVCEEIVDCLHETAPTQKEGIPSIRTSDIENGRLDLKTADRVSEEVYQKWTQRSEPQPGDIILAREAPVGEVGIVPEGSRVCLGQRTVQLRPDRSKVEPRYLLFLLLDQEMQNRMESMAAGSTVAHLNLSDIREMELPELPPLPVQRRIADILGALDDKIEVNRRMNETLEEMAQTLYRHWFVDFGPFQDREFTDTEELGPFPEGWTVGELGDYCIVNRQTVDKDNPPDPIEYIKISGVNEGRVEETETIPWEDSPTRANRRVQDGDIVWSKVRPNREGYFLCLQPPENLVVSTGFATITPREVPFTWVYLALTTDDFVDYLTARATGAAYPSVRLDAFRNAEMVVPDREALEAFHEKVEPLFRMQSSSVRENQTLAETRDYLLPKLISGELEIEGAEEIVDDTVGSRA